MVLVATDMAASTVLNLSVSLSKRPVASDDRRATQQVHILTQHLQLLAKVLVAVLSFKCSTYLLDILLWCPRPGQRSPADIRK